MEKKLIKMNNFNYFWLIPVLGTFAVVMLFGFFNVSLAATFCANGDMMTTGEALRARDDGSIIITMEKINSTQARTTMVNNTDCKLPATVQSYKVYDNISFATQKMIDDAGLTIIPPHSTHVFTSPLAPCLTQVDAFYDNRDSNSALFEGHIFGVDGRVFDSIPSADGLFCVDTSTLVASCSVNPSTTNVGGSINWSSTASGGTGSYTYSWTGTDGLSGNSSSVSKNYSSAGSKVGTVTISSGSQSVTRSCSGTVNTPTPDTLTGSCSVSPSSVNVGGNINWSSSVSGGSGSYTYSWTGTDGLSGNSSSVSKTYSNEGTKTGTVTISSGNQSITRTCTTIVNEEEEDDDLSVSCTVSQSRVDIDENVTFRSDASGGDGDYDYDWDGTDGLRGSSRNLTWSYDDDGTKRATITVTDGEGQTASDECTVRVDEEDEEEDDLSVSCYASPSTTQVGSRMNWYVRVYGGDGDYDYDWSGSEGLNSSSRSPYMTYDTPGSKRATVKVTDGDGQEDSDTCYVTVNSVLAFTQTYQPPIAPAVYLSQVPYTGVADNYKLALFVGILSLFSAWIAYIIISYKKAKGELN